MESMLLAFCLAIGSNCAPCPRLTQEEMKTLAPNRCCCLQKPAPAIDVKDDGTSQ
mgnify:CR=1 FL=1